MLGFPSIENPVNVFQAEKKEENMKAVWTTGRELLKVDGVKRNAAVPMDGMELKVAAIIPRLALSIRVWGGGGGRCGPR